MFQRLLIVLALVLFVGVTAARAQSDEEAEPKAPDRSYKLLREDEDWGFLRDPRLRRDTWDKIKGALLGLVTTQIQQFLAEAIPGFVQPTCSP